MTLQHTVAGEQRPVVLHHKGKGETVDEGKRSLTGSVIESPDHTLPVEFRNMEPVPDKIVASVPTQLALEQQVRDDELEWQTENGFDE